MTHREKKTQGRSKERNWRWEVVSKEVRARTRLWINPRETGEREEAQKGPFIPPSPHSPLCFPQGWKPPLAPRAIPREDWTMAVLPKPEQAWKSSGIFIETQLPGATSESLLLEVEECLTMCISNTLGDAHAVGPRPLFWEPLNYGKEATASLSSDPTLTLRAGDSGLWGSQYHSHTGELGL